eukprot:12711796-Ditylum_brightwellii.AAC.1
MIASRPLCILFLTLPALTPSIARPSILQEQELNYYRSFVQGAYVGFESFLALAGYYKSDEAKNGKCDDL